jgi:hypothetical protein
VDLKAFTGIGVTPCPIGSQHPALLVYHDYVAKIFYGFVLEDGGVMARQLFFAPIANRSRP